MPFPLLALERALIPSVRATGYDYVGDGLGQLGWTPQAWGRGWGGEARPCTPLPLLDKRERVGRAGEDLFSKTESQEQVTFTA